MKKLFLLIFVIAIIAGCSKDEVVNPVEPSTLKDYVMTVDLMAGQHINVGTVTYLDTEDGYFHITYTLTGGWTMNESHVYAGTYEDMPLNKPGAPKIGKFPYKKTHNPEVTTYTYIISSDGFPENDLLALAAHCCVNNTNGGNETAWAEGNECFDKGWGMWNYFSGATFVPENNSFYAIQYNESGELSLVLINGGTYTADVILSEDIASGGSLSGLAYDPLTGNLYFAIGNQLYAVNINDNLPSQYIGLLQGIPVGATVINGIYYYYNGDPNSPYFNEIIEVQITDNNNGGWTIVENTGFSGNLFEDMSDNLENPLFTESNFVITSMTSSIDGTIYLSGTFNNDTPDILSDDKAYLVTFNGTGYSAEGTFVNGDAMIAYGADGLLYVFYMDDAGDTILLEMDPGEPGSPPSPPDDDDLLFGDGSDDLSETVGGDAI